MSQAQQSQSESDNGDELSDREKRALYEPMLVMPEMNRAKGAPGLFEVYTTSEPYLVDGWGEPVCECPDFKYNLAPGEKCKHIHRMDFASGFRDIPDAADEDKIDGKLGCAFEHQ